MIWIFAVVAVAVVAIIVQLLLVYQKRAHELRLRQEPIRRHIREQLRAMEEATLKIRRTAAQRLEELGFEAERFKKQSA
jgi:beta-lactamase regulating signal transducer with metallopeptidase domain